MKKKNNTGLIIILVIIILGLVGYIVYDKVLSKEVDKKGKENSVVEEQNIDDNNIDNNRLAENENKYNNIIEEYRSAMNDKNFNDDTNSETKYPNINYTMMHYYHNYLNGYYEGSMDFKYTYYDINGDKKDEMIVGDGKDNIFEIYVYDGSKANMFIKEACLGERCSAKIWNNGIIYFEGSGGASYHSYEFYKIESDGYSKETIKKYDVEYKDSDGNTFIVTDRDTNKIVDFKSTNDIISSVKGNANDVDLSKLDWKEIK